MWNIYSEINIQGLGDIKRMMGWMGENVGLI